MIKTANKETTHSTKSGLKIAGLFQNQRVFNRINKVTNNRGI